MWGSLMDYKVCLFIFMINIFLHREGCLILILNKKIIIKNFLMIGRGLLVVSLFTALFGCGTDDKKSSSSNSKVVSSSQEENTSRVKSDTEHEVGYQLELPKSGEEIAIMSTNMGEIKMRFFEDAAPKAVENFKKHSQDGYYNGLKFHRVIDDFMIQGGDPKGNGTGGSSIWDSPFKDEFSDKLFNIRGSVAMANSGKDTNGSQFFINQAKPSSLNWDALQNTVTGIDFSKVTDEIKKLYSENGGNIHLDGALNKFQKGHTVFAQVFEGMDVVDKIAKVKVKNSVPVEDVIINKIDIVNF